MKSDEFFGLQKDMEVEARKEEAKEAYITKLRAMQDEQLEELKKRILAEK